MSKFVMECPSCGKYVEAKSGFFAKKKIDCSCGYTIDVKLDKISTRVCPHCGNTFAHDQSTGTKVRCPVCRETVVTTNNNTKTAAFSCEQCGVQLHTNQSATTYTCPVCDHVNDVAERLAKANITDL